MYDDMWVIPCIFICIAMYIGKFYVDCIRHNASYDVEHSPTTKLSVLRLQLLPRTLIYLSPPQISEPSSLPLRALAP